jgi:predicted metal-dependent phosphoesterase TrpH
MIDLHTHTTASDGRCTPPELVARARSAGVTTLGLADHDTVAGCDDAAAACRAAGIEFVAGIEITAVRDEIDVHMLGYFIDVSSPRLAAFLAEQRHRRVERIERMVAKLAALGIHLDRDAIVRPALDRPGSSIGRPAIARALVAAGHVASTNDAFSAWLAKGRPAFVAREGAPPEYVIDQIHGAGGLASLAHPGLLARDHWIADFVGAGLDAVEVYHTDHDEAAVERYRRVAQHHGIATTGGSDYHADSSHGAPHPGSVALPQAEFDRFKARLSRDPAGA